MRVRVYANKESSSGWTERKSSDSEHCPCATVVQRTDTLASVYFMSCMRRSLAINLFTTNTVEPEPTETSEICSVLLPSSRGLESPFVERREM
ncbi:hypothetical protein ElyMa_004721400 [Elysia marginata]|uniref:Uncharacterized protein n=1 Tax=Elysia marginata TaxID=1093978 RepID=A0AAV4IAJ1_9GAST|nr:hypothetical protein ElyMa_004721400 [Elysia marginata]